MNHTESYTKHKILLCLIFLFIGVSGKADDNVWLFQKIKMKKTQDTRYHLLNLISGKTGYLFMYDSNVVNNDETITVNKGEYTLKDLIELATGKNRLEITLIGKHILLNLPKQTPAAVREHKPINNHYINIIGRVFDKFSEEPVVSASISVNETSIGTVTNRSGEFRLIVSDSLLHSSLKISHVGYENAEYNIAAISEIPQHFLMEPKIIALQEVVIRPVDPKKELEMMLKLRKQNYSLDPVYLTTFYREGVEHKKRNVDLTEGVLKVYKTGYDREKEVEQVKMIKMRRVVDKQEKDTIITKLKSGVHSTLMLDVMKYIPDFLNDEENIYDYFHSDISVINNRLVNVISFEQKKHVKLPLYKGDLYIDMDTHALLEGRFKINSEYASKATDLFVEKRSRNHKLTLSNVEYVVSYRQLTDGKYYINHVRGDIEFKVKRKRQLFNTNLKVWFEMVNCKVENENVQSIPRNERLSSKTIFSETRHVFDPHFWEHFNVIVPEEKLKELIISNLNEISE